MKMKSLKRLTKFKKLKYGHAVTSSLRYFLEGYIDCKQGANFSMTPYPTSPTPNYSFDNSKSKRRGWSRGYWAAVRLEKIKGN